MTAQHAFNRFPAPESSCVHRHGNGARTSTAVRPRRARAADATPAKYRAAVIGHTGRGRLRPRAGRGLARRAATQIVAVADADPRAWPPRSSGSAVPKGYRRLPPDARRGEARPGEHLPALARPAPRHGRGGGRAGRAGHLHGEADVPHAGRGRRRWSPPARSTRSSWPSPTRPATARSCRWSSELIRSGKLGQVLEFRARGKEDRRGGGEDLWVLGTHMLNLIHHFGGEPQWCFGTV